VKADRLLLPKMVEICGEQGQDVRLPPLGTNPVDPNAREN
jgi:hypothetical protein